MEQHSRFITKIFESVFNTHRNDSPVRTARPFNERPTLSPFDMRPTFRPFQERPTMRPFHERRTLRPPHGTHLDSMPPDNKTEPPSNAVTASESNLALTLEKFLWVVLSGFGVVVLMAIFMKLVGPIRRVRRQLSHGRPAPNDEATVTLHPDDGNLDIASLVRSSADLPPPYSECVRHSTNKHDVEEPPPQFSACFVSFTNPKHTEPQVQIQRQNHLIESGLKVESVPMNNSESIAPMNRTEVVFDNGRIVERLS